MTALVQRSKEYGLLGKYLLEALNKPEEQKEVRKYMRYNLTQGMVSLSNERKMKARNGILPYAVALLCLEYPMQCEGDASDVLNIALHSYDMSGLVGSVSAKSDRTRWSVSTGRRHAEPARIDFDSYPLAALGHAIRTDSVWRRQLYPHKPFANSRLKGNLSLAALCASWARHHSDSLLGILVRWTRYKLTRDQFISCLLYCHILKARFGGIGLRIGAAALLQPENAKCLSTALKALGLAATVEGAVLTEAQTLQGRGVKPVDFAAENSARTDPVKVREKVINVDPDSIRLHIRSILDSELPRSCELPDLDRWWSARWAWCVNGSQTKISDGAMGLDPGTTAHTHVQRFRRMANEAISTEPLTKWNGEVLVSASEKLEHGKTRAIYACDTLSYYAFSYILGRTQDLWKNKRVLLDPGSGGNTGIIRRIREMQSGGGVNLMLDYDDFNSHHANSTMKVLFEELCLKFNAPAWYAEKIVSSFDSVYIHSGGKATRVLGTLMSGHRGTTFINSVLNAAYVRASVSGPVFDSLQSLHTGDDVYMRPPTLSLCADILEKCKLFGCRINPTKQSIGFVNAEFLRMAIGRNHAIGYVSRAIASLVSGNWTNDHTLSIGEALTSCITTTRSIINRSHVASVVKIIGPAVKKTRGLGLKAVLALLSGEASLESSPVYNRTNRAATYRLVAPPRSRLDISKDWATHATNDYLTDHTSDVEARGLELSGVDATSLMVASSYSKGLNPDLNVDTRWTLRRQADTTYYGRVHSSELVKDDTNYEGLLSRYPLIQMVSNFLTDDALRELVGLVGGDTGAANIREQAFGRDRTGVNIIGFLPYSDAAILSRRTLKGNIIVSFDIYM